MNAVREVRAAGPAGRLVRGRSGGAGQGGNGGGRPRLARWLAECGLGARLVVAGGREGWLRAGLTALGVGVGVTLLLLAASVPAMLAARGASDQQRALASFVEEAAADTVLVRMHGLEFRGQQIWGMEVWPEGPAAPVPAGLAELPGDGELVVSPALARLLESTDGDLLRPRLDHPVAGLIGDEGLRGPRDLAFYLGNATLAEAEVGPGGFFLASDMVGRLDQFGAGGTQPIVLNPLLLLLLVTGVVALLVPVGMFVAVAARFGGEQRDRRLAALRLVGADARATRRVAATEALVGALLGLAVGWAGFLAGRLLVGYVTVGDLNVFATDVRPVPALAALVVLAVPVLAVVATLLAMRKVVIEPLGVFRRATAARRRLWWRLTLPAAGVGMLHLAADTGTGDLALYQMAAGIVLVLLGVAALLPWLVDMLTRRLRGGGPLAWQLAIRRLQLTSGSTGRVVNGVAVAVAGAIALQVVFGAAEGESVFEAERPDAGPDAPWVHAADPDRLAQAMLYASWPESLDQARADQVTGAFAATPGVRSGAGLRIVTATDGRGGPGPDIWVGDCAALAAVARLDGCADGDVFLVDRPAAEPGEPDPPPVRGGPVESAEAAPDLPGASGSVLWFGEPDDDDLRWEVPESARAVTSNGDPFGSPADLLATPGAGLPEEAIGTLKVFLELDPAVPDAIEHVRNTAAGVDRFLVVRQLQLEYVDQNFAMLRRALLFGVAATLLMVGTSLLVSTVEQLRERRRQLAMLVAFGTRRRTLAWSVLWQTALPVALGLLVAAGAGIGLGSLLLAMVEVPPVIDVGQLAFIAGTAATVVLLVTALALPVLWRLMRPDGLRTE